MEASRDKYESPAPSSAALMAVAFSKYQSCLHEPCIVAVIISFMMCHLYACFHGQSADFAVALRHHGTAVNETGTTVVFIGVYLRYILLMQLFATASG